MNEVCRDVCVPGKNKNKSDSKTCVCLCLCVCVCVCVCVRGRERVVSEKAVCGEWVTEGREGGKPATCSHDRL